jgi:hypothetical protein
MTEYYNDNAPVQKQEGGNVAAALLGIAALFLLSRAARHFSAGAELEQAKADQIALQVKRMREFTRLASQQTTQDIANAKLAAVFRQSNAIQTMMRVQQERSYQNTMRLIDPTYYRYYP